MGEIFAGRYELIDPIGRGGVGAVWRSWDHRRRRYVAAKVLQQSDAHTLLRFVREQALRIDHPHVLAPASWAADDAKVLFTMELVSGGSLAHLIGDYGPLPPRFVCTLLDQLLSGLTAVHAEGVVHRDIKPANILLEATGTGRPHLRLSDFGISMRKGEPRLTETNYVVGTPGYFAPEQMLGAEPDFPADLFATGLVALYLLTGRKPDAQGLIEHFAAHGMPSAPAEVPEPLWQVLANLLQPDPDARFRTATGARKALTAAVELLPDSTLEEEAVEVFDHIGPLPTGFGPHGPVQERPSPAPDPVPAPVRPPSETGSFPLAPPAWQQGYGYPGQQGYAGQAYAGQQGHAGQGYAGRQGHAGQPGPPAVPLPEQPSTPPTPTPMPMAAPAPMPASAPAPAPAGSPAQAGAAPGQDPVGHSRADTVAVRLDHAATRPYTAPQPSGPSAPPAGRAGAQPAPRQRPGPPPKVTVPVLVLALLCFAVGIWALAAS